MFNKDTLKHSLLKKQTLAIILILIAGGIGSVYATTISDTTSIFQNVPILGTCSGCGGSGSFTNYNTIALNTTTPGNDVFGFCAVKIGNDGTVIIGGASRNQIVYLNGTTVYNQAGNACNVYAAIDQSVDGKYKLVFIGSTFLASVFKDNSKVQDLGYNTAQCNVVNGASMAISPDGHYITAVCQDSGAASDRVVVFRGT